jgi:DNA replication protein DnaC
MSETGSIVVKTAGGIIKSGRGGIEELPEQAIECVKHGVYRGCPFKASQRIGHKDHIAYPECPQCAEERKAREKADAERRESNRFAAMNIGRRYWDTGFETFSAYTDELKRHLKTAENFAKNPGGKLVMLGDNGTGKTHLAISILKITGGVIYTAFEIGVKLRKSCNGGSREWEVLKDLCETEMLAIDEIGRSKGEGWEMNWMSHIINKRHENILPTILISNRHLMQDCPRGEKGCPKCLEFFFDNDVISRITEDGIVLKFAGEDYRQRQGEAFRKQKRIESGGAANGQG